MYQEFPSTALVYAYRAISDPIAVVQVNQHVKVTVLEIDILRKRIALSMKAGQGETT